MLTTRARNDLVSAAKYLREHPYLEDSGEADAIDDQLTADDLEMAACQESIARGDACPSCEQDWVPDGPKLRKLDHLPSCLYSMRLLEEDL